MANQNAAIRHSDLERTSVAARQGTVAGMRAVLMAAMPAAFALALLVGTPTLARLEHDYIRYILASVADNRTQAACVLGIVRRTLYRKLEEPES